jgi:hypothetical protein
MELPVQTEYTPEERKAFMHKAVDPKMQVSPRLGIAYPISDAGVIHFSYGHFFQIPQYGQMYAQPDFKINPSGGYTVFGNADLKAKLRPLYGHKPNRIDKLLDQAKARKGNPAAEAKAFENPIAGPKGWIAAGALVSAWTVCGFFRTNSIGA